MITITFNPSTPQQMAILADAMVAYVKADQRTDDVAAAPVAEPAPAAKPKGRKPSAAAAAAEPEPAPTPVAEPAITLEQIRAKMAAKSQAGKGPECKALLSRFAATNLTAVPADHYADLMAAVEAL